MKQASGFLIIFVAILTFVTSDTYAETQIYGKVESFTWKEFDLSGNRLLKESGPIYSLGIESRFFMGSNFTISPMGEIFYGAVNYDGQTQAGVPVETDTDYLGLKLEGDIGYYIEISRKVSLEPFLGLGYRLWYRDLESTDNAVGYLERWYSMYTKTGLRSNYDPNKTFKLYGEAGIRYPLKNENTAYLSSISSSYQDITLEPGREISFFGEAGIKYHGMFASIYYESLKFSKSATVSGFYQPESEAGITGLKIGIEF
jgi:hypothetical protein